MLPVGSHSNTLEEITGRRVDARPPALQVEDTVRKGSNAQNKTSIHAIHVYHD